MGKVYCDTGGNANYSGSRDTGTPHLSGAAATRSSVNTVTLDGSPDLSGVVTSGANQDSIMLDGATNSNRKIFWITAVDNVAKTVTVDVDPTGINSPTTTAWAIGGRHVWTKTSIEGAIRAGDEIIFNNSPASSSSGSLLTARVAGTGAAGMPWVRGAAGTRPVLTSTNAAYCITTSGSPDGWRFSNLEIVQSAATGGGANCGVSWIFQNVKISDAGWECLGIQAAGCKVIGCDLSGAGNELIYFAFANKLLVYGSYLHDSLGDGIETGNNVNIDLIFNIIDSNAGRGVNIQTADTLMENGKHLISNTIYGNGNSGLEVVDADTLVVLMNNIFAENGNAAGEYNVEWVAGDAEKIGFHAWNIFYHSGGGGGANLSNLTVNAFVTGSEFTTDPGFTDAVNGDFTISSSSPAKAAGFPGLFGL